jgi:hypothetical protein
MNYYEEMQFLRKELYQVREDLRDGILIDDFRIEEEGLRKQIDNILNK